MVKGSSIKDNKEWIWNHTDGLLLIVVGQFSHFICLFAIVLAALLRKFPQDLTGGQSGCDTVSALQKQHTHSHTHLWIVKLHLLSCYLNTESDYLIYSCNQISIYLSQNNIWMNTFRQTTTNKNTKHYNFLYACS